MERKAYRLKAGSLSNLKCVTETLPDPEAHEVQVAVKAIGLNFADVFAIWGLYSATPKGSFVPGLEYSGVVKAVGKEVSNVKIGDKVMGVTRFGAYASHLNIDARYVIPLHDNWTYEEGAAYLVQALTAYYGLIYLANIQEGSTVLVHSAAGGVGIWANRIAKHYKAFTIGTIGSSNKLDFLKKEGYDRAIVRGNDFSQKLEVALGGRELNTIMECIGGKIFSIGYDRLAQQGRMIVYGSARYASPGNRPNYFRLIWQFLTRPKIDPQKMIELNKAIMGFNLIWLYEKAELMHEVLAEFTELELGKPHIGHTFEFENFHDAIKKFQTGQTIGKVIVRV